MRFNIKKAAFFIIKLALSSMLLFVVFRHAGAQRVLDVLMTINPATFVLAVAVYLLSQLVSSLRWRILLDNGQGVWRIFNLYMLGAFFNRFLPGLVGGDAIKAYYLYKITGHGPRAFASVFMDRFIGYASLMALGAVSYAIGYKSISGTWVQWFLPLTVLLFIGLSSVFIRFKIGSRFRHVADVYGFIYSYGRKAPALAKAFALSLLVQALFVYSIYLLARGLGEDIPVGVLFIYFPIITTVATLPITISGVGAREAAFVLLLGTLGIEPHKATAISFAWFLSTSIGGLWGLFEYLKERPGAIYET